MNMKLFWSGVNGIQRDLRTRLKSAGGVSVVGWNRHLPGNSDAPLQLDDDVRHVLAGDDDFRRPRQGRILQQPRAPSP